MYTFTDKNWTDLLNMFFVKPNPKSSNLKSMDLDFGRTYYQPTHPNSQIANILIIFNLLPKTEILNQKKLFLFLIPKISKSK